MEVLDDHWVGGAQGDRLDVFLPAAAPGHAAPTRRAVSVRLADARGAPLPDGPVVGLPVERAVEPLPGRAPSVRFKFALPSLRRWLSRDHEGELSSAAVPLVLAYSDVDPTSPRVERRIATAAPPRGRAAPEGSFRSFPVEVATCEIRERLLEPRVARTFRRDEAACVPPLL